MKFEPNTIYHIFNQGNNRQRIFFQEKNYDYFLGKMERHLLPHGDFICYCLMPNHFHWLFKTNAYAETKDIASDKNNVKPVTLINQSLATLLSSYTRGVNNQENRTGSLFRSHTKSKSGRITTMIADDGKAQQFLRSADPLYAKNCFQYIHQNPVKANLCLNPEDWPYSSATQYLLNDQNGLCNIALGRALSADDS